ncbi:hypothetical protein BDV93DRAFT_610320 [Ceratobasidium sp. AG-I]|nr:hypothetical protein BDV93DRAFT_610320 [Ceratobasidium sp. AG-I]
MHTPDNAPNTEQTPLLSGVSSQRDEASSSGACPPAPHKPIREPLLHKAITLAFVFLSLLLCLAVAIVLTAHSYASPLLQADPALLAQRALAFKGPSHVNVLNYTADGLWCEVAGEAAIDVALAMRLSGRFSDRLVGWAVRQVGHVTVSTSTITIYSLNGAHLASVQLPEVVLPLATSTPPSLVNMSIQALVKPARNNQDLVDFALKSWQRGFLEVRVDVSKVVVVGGRKTHSHSWRNYVHVAKHDVSSVIKAAVPSIPGLPPTPPNEPRPIPDLASLVYLQSYHVLPPPPTLRLIGTATLPNLAPSILRGAVALSLPFVVSLPPATSGHSLAIARVETAPLALTVPNISLVISGHVLPLPSSSSSIAPVSRFASDFLAARASPILVTTDFLRDLGMSEELTVEAEFPAAAERPDLLRDVKISNMRISLHGEQILASAFVRAHIVPPSNLAALRVNATRVWPDLLVYDGPAPGLWPLDDPAAGSHSGIQYDEGWSEPSPMPLPNPLPPTAFARIRPDAWIIAHTEVNDDEGGSKEEGVWVHAQVSDVPLVVLPGRDSELRGFIRKVLFNPGGARAGVAGIAGVAARVGGLVVGSKESGELEMFGLPLRGEAWVGKKNIHEPGWGMPMPKNPLPEPPMSSELPALPDLPSFPLPVPHMPKLPLPTPRLLLPFPEPEPELSPTPTPTSTPEPEPELPTEDWNVSEDTDADYNYSAEEVEEDFGGPYSDEQNTKEMWQVGVAY